MRQYLSFPLSAKTHGYGNGPGFKRKFIKSIPKGDTSNSEFWELPNHIGTHIDCPNHFFEGGDSIDAYPPDFWFFQKPFLLEAPDNVGGLIGVSDLFEAVPCDCDLILVKTGFNQFRGTDKYWSNNPGLAPEFADWIRVNRQNVRVVGMDFISVSRWQGRETGRESHRRFLNPDGPNNPLLLIEDMDLGGIDRNSKLLSVAVVPLIIESAGGSPCTVIAETAS